MALTSNFGLFSWLIHRLCPTVLW